MDIVDAAKGVALAVHALGSSLLAFVIILLCKLSGYLTHGYTCSSDRVLGVQRRAILVLHYTPKGLLLLA